MTNMNDRQRKQMTPQIMEKQGGYFCNGCKRDPEALVLSGILPKLYIDCIPNDGDHSDVEKLQFLCVSCNTKKNHPANSEPLDTSKTDPIFNASKVNTERARQYITGRLLDPKDGPLEFHELLNDMAEFLDNSQQANKNYLAKFTSKKHGLFKWSAGSFGKTVLKFKDEKSMDAAVKSRNV